MEGLQALLPDPRLALLFMPQVMLLIGGLIAGLVQATRKTRIDSGWLPHLSGAYGVIVGLVAVLTTGAQFTGSVIGFALLFGLSMGLATTGFVAVGIHWNTGTTDGASTAHIDR